MFPLLPSRASELEMKHGGYLRVQLAHTSQARPGQLPITAHSPGVYRAGGKHSRSFSPLPYGAGNYLQK